MIRKDIPLGFHAQLLDAVGQAVVATDLGGSITYWNRAAEDLYGWTAEEVLGRNVIEVTPAHASQQQAEEIMARLRAGERWSGEFMVQRKDGRTFLAAVTDVPLYDDAGELAGIIGVSTDITAQKRAEQTVKESRERFQLFMEHMPGAAFIKDAEGRLVYANQRFAALAGEETADLIGQGVEAYTPADLVAQYREEHQRVLSTGQTLMVESMFPGPSGLQHWITFKFPIYQDDAPALVGGVSLDITARKQAEAALKEGEALFRGVVRESSDGIIVTDERGKIVVWNRAQARITGLPPSEALGRSIVDVLFELTPQAQRDDEQFDYLGHYIQTALETGKTPWSNQMVERRLERPGGACRFTRSAIFTIKTRRGFALASTTRDVTAHKRLEAALQEKHQQLMGIISRSPNIITLMDREGRYLLVNRATAELLGCSEADLVGKTFAEVLPPETATLFMERLRTVLETQSTLQVEDIIPALAGEHAHERAYTTTLFPLHDLQGDVYAVGGLALDITERVRAEREIERYAAELERSNQDLEQFAYVISHDLREPLRMVTGYLALLERRYRGELDEPACEFLDYALDGAERMQEMIRALLNLSRVGTRGRAFAPTDVEAVLARAQQALGRAIEEAGAEVTHDPLPMVMADEAQLVQVLQNLIANGIKFCWEDTLPRVHVSAQRGEGEWVFAVADNGIGTDPGQAERMFRFFSGCKRGTSMRAWASAWRCAGASSSGMVGASGLNRNRGRARRSILRCRIGERARTGERLFPLWGNTRGAGRAVKRHTTDVASLSGLSRSGRDRVPSALRVRIGQVAQMERLT